MLPLKFSNPYFQFGEFYPFKKAPPFPYGVALWFQNAPRDERWGRFGAAIFESFAVALFFFFFFCLRCVCTILWFFFISIF